MAQARYWLLTIPHEDFTPYLPDDITYIRGQLELGSDTGYLHWQLLAIFRKKARLRSVKRVFGERCHAEPSRSEAADEYVWKDDTAVSGTRFELGKRPMRRNNDTDWEAVLDNAKRGRLDDIPGDVLVRCYHNIKRIAVDNIQAIGIERSVIVFWGPTGVGKSRRAWDQAGINAYPKDPLTKFWDGYNGQEHVVIDEFRGGISIGHILRWFDRYPVIVEVKGSSTVLKAQKIWITSNINPRLWYPELDEPTQEALLRRLEIHECPINLY